MSGTPSEADLVEVETPRPRFDPPAQRGTIRITNLFGTTWEPVERLGTTGAVTEFLRFGRLAGYYGKAADQLPAVASQETLDVSAVRFNRWSAADGLVSARLWFLVMPSGQVVVGFSIDISSTLVEAIEVLEDCYYTDVEIDGLPLERYVCRSAQRLGLPDANEECFTPERHQIVFSRELTGGDQSDTIQKLVYRSDLPYRQQYSAIEYPAELNRRPGTSVGLGPYVSVMFGQQDYVENSAFVSAAQAVASAVRLREVRDLAYEDVRLFRDAQATTGSVQSRRHTLERMSNQLGNLELELSFSVESSADLALLVPSLRVVAYHDALYQCMGLREKATTVGRMLKRLERSIAAELTAIESVERRADEDRRMRWSVAIGFLSTVTLPVTLVLTFFGINAREVSPDRSMFDNHYWPMYLLLLVIILAGLTLSGGLLVQQRQQHSRDEQRAAEAMTAVRSMTVVRRKPARTSGFERSVSVASSQPSVPAQRR
ncbi:hypothetical protein [Actinoplanes regularis]|uniref:hypothetical protein n=1 Tax=Actinoplanes regularis TaxID=52697 RepID=UPI0024A25021|nr:hypothetical protein [Actinoplanes regularis]GLW32998.1 hypothetical protein Areg01_59360 [Actinoplanes regularis]